ncbi:hypothetical protein AAVH_30287 [Aphelenchoides avenae]|nr:hypothetical protein AAVH_30287 [Aphelenchus avenae]
MEMGHHSDVFADIDRPAIHSTGSGLALLAADVWVEAAQFLSYINTTTLRFTSEALNCLIQQHSSILPLRLVETIVVGRTNSEQVYWAFAFQADSRTLWRDLVFENRASLESILFDVLTKCKGFAIARLELRDLPYNGEAVNVVKTCSFVTVSELCVNGVASGHEQVVPGLLDVHFDNGEVHPNAAAVLSVCAARKTPTVTLNFAADVTDTMILDFLLNNNSRGISRKCSIVRLGRSLSKNFFEMIVEGCRRNECSSLKFGLAGLLTDPTDTKYGRYIVERLDVVDRNTSMDMYRFGKRDRTNVPFTVVVTKSQRFSLSVFQGAANDLCSSLGATRKIDVYRL